jgi:FAD/FMN-containing dehydrogenase
MAPATVDEVVVAVQGANRSKTPVRPVGSAWSFSDCIYTEDILLDMRGLNRTLGYAHVRGRGGATWTEGPAPALRGALRLDILRADEERYFVHTQAGATIESLNRFLDYKGATLSTMGSSSGQTIAGAISTGTHGGHFDRPPIADYVRALLVVDPGGGLHWIEGEGDRALIDQDRWPGRPDIGADIQLHQDDELLDAALVSFGCLGVVVEVVLECRRQALLSRVSKMTTWASARQWIVDWMRGGDTLAGQLRHPAVHLEPGASTRTPVTPIHEALEVFISPHRNDDDYSRPRESYWDRDCLLVSVARADADDLEGGEFIAPPPDLDETEVALDVELHGHGGLRRAARQIMQAARPDTGGYFKAHTVLSTYTGFTRAPSPRARPVPVEPSPGFTSEVVLPTEAVAYLRFLDDFFEKFDTLQGAGQNFAGFLSLRFTRGTRALMGMQRFAEQPVSARVCHVEFQALKEFNMSHVLISFGFALAGSLVAAGAGSLPDPDIDHSGNLEGHSDEHLRAGEDLVSGRLGKMHWGQFHRLNRIQVLADYGDDLHRWRVQRTKLLGAGHDRLLSNSFTRRCGLESNREAFAAAAASGGDVHLVALGPVGTLLHATTSDLEAESPRWAWRTNSNAWGRADHIVGPLAATSWGVGRVDVFGVGVSGRLLHWWQDGGSTFHEALTARWPDAFSADLRYAGPMVVSARGERRLTLVALLRGGELMRFDYDGRWSSRSLGRRLFDGRRIVGGLSGVATGASRFDLLGIDDDARVVHVTSEGPDIASRVGPFSSRCSLPPAICARRGASLRAFAVNARGDVEASELSSAERWTSPGKIGDNQFPADEVQYDHPEQLGEQPADAYYRYQRRVGPRRISGALQCVISRGREQLLGPDSKGNVLHVQEGGDGRWRWHAHERGWRW